MTSEPIAVINTLVGLVEAAISLAVGLGKWNLDKQQVALVMALVVAIGNVAKTVWARGQVTPVASPRNFDGQRLVPVVAAMKIRIPPARPLRFPAGA